MWPLTQSQPGSFRVEGDTGSFLGLCRLGIVVMVFVDAFYLGTWTLKLQRACTYAVLYGAGAYNVECHGLICV